MERASFTAPSLLRGENARRRCDELMHGPGAIVPAGASAHDLVTDAQALLRPAYAYASLAVKAFDEHALYLEGDCLLASPVAARLFARAQEVVLLAYTIGPLLEIRAGQHAAAGNAGWGRLLDCLGTLAVHELGAIAHDRIKEIASRRGLQASIPLNPGTSHWPVRDIGVFVDVIPGSAIALEVRPDGWLTPIKSIAMAIALGNDLLTDADGSSCDYCDHPELCRMV